MSGLTLSGIIFVLMLGGIFLGTLLRRTLPEHHLNEHGKDLVRLGAGLIATVAAFRSFCPCPRELDDLPPLVGLLSNEFSEIGRGQPRQANRSIAARRAQVQRLAR
jgi:hypothetical protein